MHNYNNYYKNNSAGSRDYMYRVDRESFQYVQQYSKPQPPPASLEYLRAAKIIMQEHNTMHMPHNVHEALSLFLYF